MSGVSGQQGFGITHIVSPRTGTRHTQTIVLLHGRGTNGKDFADELFSSDLSDGRSLRDALPGVRWVFPCAKEEWSTTFQEHMPSWFEVTSLGYPNERQDLQMDGIKASVEHVGQVLAEEMEMLAGHTEQLVLGGISQGGAVALWTLLCRRDLTAKLGGFVGASTWLPFCDSIARIVSNEQDAQTAVGDRFVEAMMGPWRQEEHMSVAVLLGHGIDDAYVDVQLGRQAARILSSAGCRVEWNEYSGAEQEGHWLKVPEQTDHIREFLSKALAR